jgi:hypothetical protein
MARYYLMFNACTKETQNVWKVNGKEQGPTFVSEWAYFRENFRSPRALVLRGIPDTPGSWQRNRNISRMCGGRSISKRCVWAG